MHARLQLAQAVELRRGHVIAGVHQGAVQVQGRRLGAFQVQRQLLVPPHIRRHDLLPVPGLAHERMPPRQPSGFHGHAILRIRRRHPLPGQVRRPGQDDAVGKQRTVAAAAGSRYNPHSPVTSSSGVQATAASMATAMGATRDLTMGASIALAIEKPFFISQK